jgi:hypothetical protein
MLFGARRYKRRWTPVKQRLLAAFFLPVVVGAWRSRSRLRLRLSRWDAQ